MRALQYSTIHTEFDCRKILENVLRILCKLMLSICWSISCNALFCRKLIIASNYMISLANFDLALILGP